MRNAAQSPVRVIFIAGSNRSGSTILDRALGCGGSEAIAVGEIRGLWDAIDTESHPGLCGCGQPIHRCIFWRAVIERAFGQYETVPVAHFKKLTRQIENSFYPRLWLTPNRVDGVSEYSDIVRRLYSAVTDVSGGKAILDSSKFPPQGLILAGLPGINLTSVHLVRDSRAVAFSLLRGMSSSVTLPMARRPAIKAAWSWNREQVAAEMLRFRAHDQVQVRYEDFARAPAATLNSLSHRLGLPAGEVSSDDSVILKADHVVRSNPGRFLTGEVQIREDDEWKTAYGRATGSLLRS